MVLEEALSGISGVGIGIGESLPSVRQVVRRRLYKQAVRIRLWLQVAGERLFGEVQARRHQKAGRS